MSDVPGHRIALFDQQDDVTADDVVAVWRRETGMPEDVARDRVGQLLVVAIGDDRDVAGVATSYLKRNEQLRMEMWHVRVFVARAHRGGKLAIALAQSAREALHQRFAAGDTTGGGVLFEVQHEGLKTIDRAHWRRTGFTFIGENARGDHVRVAFFPGVPAPEPAA